MRPPRAIDNGIFQIRTSDYVEPRDPFNGQFNYNAQNKTLIISPADGQTDFPINGLYEFFKNEDYTKYRIKLSATGDFENPDEVINVTAGTLTGEQQATLTAGAWHIKVVPITSNVPSIPDEITGVTISIGADSVIEGSTITRIGVVQGTGNYNMSGTWTRQSGSATTFTVSGNEVAITGATAGTSDVYRFTADDGTFAEITIEVTEADANPTIQNDSIDGDLIALNDLYTQTGGPDGFWDVSTGWPIADTASMGDAYGITVWGSGENAGRVKSVNLQYNGLRNIELNANGAPVIVHKDTGSEISVFNGDDPVITASMGSSGTRPTLAVDLTDRYKERYKLIEGKEILPSIGNLQKCEEFTIALNQLGGPMPEQMQALSSCVRWAVGGYLDGDQQSAADNGVPMWEWNDGSGGYPVKFSQWFNKFEGRLHPNIGSLMPNLKSLYCARNYFDNTTIPDSIFDLTLEHLSIGHNGFVGSPKAGSPAFANTLVECVMYGGTAHSTRNTQVTQNEGANIHLGSTVEEINLPDFIGFCGQLGKVRVGYNNWSGPIPTSWAGLTSAREIELQNDAYTGPFPDFFNRDNMPTMSTLVISSINIDSTNENPPGLPSDYNVEVMSGKVNFGLCKIGGVTPLGWRDYDGEAIATMAGKPYDPELTAETDPDYHRLRDKLQIWDLRDCGISGPIYTDFSQFYNMKSCRLQGNNFDSELPQDWPVNDRLTQLTLTGSNFHGTIRPTFRKISSNKFGAEFNNNNISGYEKPVDGPGAFGAVEFDGQGNYVSGFRGGGVRLNNNNLPTTELDKIILDVADNLESRLGTSDEPTGFTLDISNQKTLDLPSDTTEINNAIAYINNYAGGTGQIII